MATRNYKSDFNFILRLYSVLTDSAGKEKERTELPWPDYDWSAKFWTSSKAKAYYASCIGGVCTNCRNMDGKIQIVVDNHNMGLGILQVEFRAELPREIYPDGSERNVVPGVLDIELVRGAGDFPSDFEAQLQMPYIKLKYEDLTEEEKAEFQRPVTEATESLQEFQTTAEAAEVKREANEKRRVQMENKIGSAEQNRQTSEVARRTAENERIEAESDREEAETSRVSAEEKRAEAFATWESEIDSKADRSELSNVLAAKQDALTTSDDLSISADNKLSLTDMAKKRLFIDMWNNACGNNGSYDPDNAPDAEHPFLLNGLWMTYEEALVCYRESSGANYLYDYCHAFSTARTFLPVRNSRGSWGNNSYYAFARCANLEVLDFDNSVYVGISSNSFSSCIKLREIRNGRLIVNAQSKDALNLPNLESFTARVVSDFNLSNASKVTYDSIEYMVSNAVNTSPITITLHPEAYARVTDDLFALAAEKNITFATT